MEEPRRRNRKPTTYGTCQVCGDVVALAVRSDPHHVIKHGYAVIEGHDEVPCAGSGYPPLEVSRERGEALAKLYRERLSDLRMRGSNSNAPPPGLTGAAALRARFTSTSQPAVESFAPDTRASAKIAEVERSLRDVENTLLTGASAKQPRPKASLAHRLNAIFRRNKDSLIYIVESMDAPAEGLARKNRRLAPTYLCRCVDTGKRVRITQNELTRALNEQGDSKPVAYGMVQVAPSQDEPANRLSRAS